MGKLQVLEENETKINTSNIQGGTGNFCQKRGKGEREKIKLEKTRSSKNRAILKPLKRRVLKIKRRD